MSTTRVIELTVNGKDLSFRVDLAAYNKYLNELVPTNKVGPAHNFLMRTISPDDKDALKAILDMPGAGLQLAGKILEEFTPDIEIELGESKRGQEQ